MTQVGGFVAAAALDRTDELAAQLVRAAYETPWVEACRYIVEGHLHAAGDVLDSHGAHAYSAMVWLTAAELASAETPQLRRAIAFYERVGATAYLSRAARLEQASA